MTDTAPPLLLDNLTPAFRHFWHPVLLADELGRSPITVTVAGVGWVLWRTADGAVGAVRDECPHRGASLGVGRCVGDTIRCAYHGWRFGPDGTCEEVPSMTGPVPAGFAAVAPYAVAERYGLVWLAEHEPRAPIPAFDDWGADGFASVHVPTQCWRTSAAQMTDNFLDLTHFPFLHAGSFAEERPVPMPAHRCEPAGHGFTFSFRGDVGERRTTGGFEPVRYDYELALPYWVRSTIHYEHSGVRQAIVTVMTPQTADTTLLFTLLARNDVAPDDEVAIAEAVTWQERVADEDRAILDATPMRALDLDLRNKRNCPADRPSVAMHRAYAEVLRAAPENERGVRHPLAPIR